MNLYGIILAGGGGTRLWPLSRQDRPKPLLNLLGERSMLQDTVARLQPLITPDRLFIAVNAVHAPEVARQIPDLPADQIVVEPVARETGPAFGLAAAWIAHHDPDATIASFHADHVVLQPSLLRDAVALAAEAAQDGAIVTIGIQPTYAATGYGYIELAGEIGTGHGHTVREAVRFVEKPKQDVAEEYVASGNFVWNAGLFICKVQTLLDAFADHLPETYAGLMRIKEAIGTKRYVETLETVFPALQKISIDVGIMEKFHPLKTRSPR
jgi:mannose-1-phosphate guanylyltransferase